MNRGKTGEKRLHAITLTKMGALAALKIGAATGAEVYAPERFCVEGAKGFSKPVAGLVEELWGKSAGLILVMAAGIAVRSIAPLLKSKYEDPPVVLVDTKGLFAVPLLAGHLGGANELSLEISRKCGMTPVITTATDCAQKPAIEVWAREKGLSLEGKKRVADLNGAFANADPACLYIEEGLDFSRYSDIFPHFDLVTDSLAEACSFRGAVAALTFRILPLDALYLRPKVLYMGAGCRLDADPSAVCEGVLGALDEAGLCGQSVKALYSVDAKRGEKALLDLAERLGVEFITFSAKELEAVKTPNPSARVREAVGTPSVCEAAALFASGGKLLMEKKSGGTWTAAVALPPVEKDR